MNASHGSESRPWHASATLLRDYAESDLDVARSASVEQHLLACDACRTALSAVIGEQPLAGGELDALWLDVIDAVDRPRPDFFGSLLHRLGIADHVAKLVAATPALRGSWIMSIVLVLAFAVVSAEQLNGNDALLLIIAPLIPLAGIGTAYGSGADPLYEVLRAAPRSGARIFLYRSLAVLVTALPLTAAASLLLSIDGLSAMGWLLPALGLVGATMALSTWIPPRLAAIAAGAAWLAVLFVAWARSARIDGTLLVTTFAFRPLGQVAFAAIALGGAAVFAARYGRLDQPGNVRLEAR